MSTTGQNIDALDGLRGCAALLIVLLHVLQYVPRPPTIVRQSIGAWSMLETGVELFFVLSGFLLFLPYARAAFIGGPIPSTKRFFQRRALRILPAYWASLAICVMVISLAGSASIGTTDIALHIALAHNLLSSTDMSINGLYWTMAIEVQFYMILPLIATVLVSKIRSRNSSGVIAIFTGLLLVSAVAFAATHVLHRLGGGFARFVDAPDMFQYLPVFGVGIAASLGFVAATEGPWADRGSRGISRIIGVTGLALLGFLVLVNQLAVHYPYAGTLIPEFTGVAYGAILLGVVLGWQSWERALKRRWIRFVGMISYSLYIWNLVVLKNFVLPRVGGLVRGSVATILIGLVFGVAVLIPLSLASYLAFERPFIGIRRSRHEFEPSRRVRSQPAD